MTASACPPATDTVETDGLPLSPDLEWRVLAFKYPAIANYSCFDIIKEKLNVEIFDKIHCILQDDSTGRADVVINRKKNQAMVLDSITRLERDTMQPHQTDEEKRDISEPCFPYFSSKYNKWSVQGILFEARGLLSKYDQLKLLECKLFTMKKITVQILRDSLQIPHMAPRWVWRLAFVSLAVLLLAQTTSSAQSEYNPSVVSSPAVISE
ncbi:hypothetical protein ANN_05855 [Periplaneta americana]|uniref:Uncharacterized protein n=1 Tax=Periplaneta americana TaxID=6978 RepID=A0ABQ8TD88_PERAM|nr:hypothetical protein ANN_05855 [Periplaneta americana]